MSKKVTNADMLGETFLPADLFTPTEGLNGLMDTYPDMDYGSGVMYSDPVPDTPPLAGVPDGVVVAEDDGDGDMYGGLGDIEGVVKEATLPNLDWLELAEQDPERLPVNPVDKAVPELEEAWGIDRRTDGVSIIPNQDLEVVSFRASLQDEGSSYRFSKEDLARVVRRAYRKASSGVPFEKIARQTALELEEESPRVAQVMRHLRLEHGLLGRIYIRADAYPGCHNRKWSKTAHKVSPARYIISKKQCVGCVHSQEGRCSIFKKKLVESVPWMEARDHYASQLNAEGRPVSMEGDAKIALMNALGMAPRVLPAVSSHKPVHVPPSDQISLQEARRAFSEAPQPVAKILGLTQVERIRRRNRKDLAVQISKWSNAGLLSDEDRDRLTGSSASPHDVLKAGAMLIASVKSAGYEGVPNKSRGDIPDISRESALRILRDAEDKTQTATKFLQYEMRRRDSVPEKRILSRLVHWVADGLLSKEDAERLAKSKDSPHEILERAAALVIEGSGRVIDYTGHKNKGKHVPMASASEAWEIVRAATDPDPVGTSRSEMIAHMSRWMSKGYISKDDVRRLARAKASPGDTIKVAAHLVASRIRNSGEYSGLKNAIPEVSTKDAWLMLDKAASRVERATQEIKEEAARREASLTRKAKHMVAVKAKVDEIKDAYNKGLRGRPLVNIMRRCLGSDDIHIAAPLLEDLRKVGAFDPPKMQSKIYADGGRTYERSIPQKATKAQHPKEVKGVLHWARRQMTEGAAGQDLDELLMARFGGSLLKESSDALADIRSEHEGLSGIVYVDASVYSTCREGGSIHRTNQIKTVMEMDKCASCANRRAREDGTPVCGVYRKVLAKEVLVEDPKAFQEEQIRLANASDAESTASLFSPAYDQKEFHLQAGEYDQTLDISTAPSSEELGEILFGGMEL